eukprot:GHVS01014273.1.p1 GENE.GHVS01014273.1~~GHVS01014273.1.p1  ORF type:complete len:115 (+),score=5.84 GHVS01014273.1:430-774(+)
MCVDVMRWKLIRGLQYMMNLYEGGTEQAFYKGDKFTGMAYDTELNEAVISAVAVPDHDILTEFVKMAGGAYNLIDATAMDMLQVSFEQMSLVVLSCCFDSIFQDSIFVSIRQKL